MLILAPRSETTMNSLSGILRPYWCSHCPQVQSYQHSEVLVSLARCQHVQPSSFTSTHFDSGKN